MYKFLYLLLKGFITSKVDGNWVYSVFSIYWKDRCVSWNLICLILFTLFSRTTARAKRCIKRYLSIDKENVLYSLNLTTYNWSTLSPSTLCFAYILLVTSKQLKDFQNIHDNEAWMCAWIRTDESNMKYWSNQAYKLAQKYIFVLFFSWSYGIVLWELFTLGTWIIFQVSYLIK